MKISPATAGLLALVLIFLTQGAAQAQPEKLFEVAWDSGQLTLLPAGPDHQAQGPAAVALGPNGRIWILDSAANRLQGFERTGKLTASVGLPAHAHQLLAAAPDGTFVVYASHLRRLTWLDIHGTVLSQRDLPLHLAAVRAMGFNDAQELELEDLHGQLFKLGRMAEPRTDREALLDRRYGPPGSVAQCGINKQDGDIWLSMWTIEPGLTSSREPRVDKKALGLPNATSAHLVSPCTQGSVLAEVERLLPSPTLSVERSVAQIENGRIGHTWTMPDDWPFVPAGRFASAKGEILLIHPQTTGLQVWSWRRP